MFIAALKAMSLWLVCNCSGWKTTSQLVTQTCIVRGTLKGAVLRSNDSKNMASSQLNYTMQQDCIIAFAH